MKLPKLYHRASKGDLRSWEVWTEEDEVVTSYGVVDGAKQEARYKALPKNVGKKNQTSPSDQAESEARSLWQKKLDRKYSETPEEAQVEAYGPMLAKDFNAKKVKYPAYIQPKMDGCFPANAMVLTSKGSLPIGRIVKEKLELEVTSWNEETKEFEQKKVINHFNNGKANQKEWLDIKLESNRRIRCTKNHKLLTNLGWVEAQNLDNDIHKLASHSSTSRLVGLIYGTLLGDSSVTIEKRGDSPSPRLIFSHVNKELFHHKVKALGLPGRIIEVTTGYGSKALKFTSSGTNIDIDYSPFYEINPNSPNLGQRKPITQQLLKKYLSREGLSLWIADDGNLNFNNGNPETPILNIATHDKSIEEIQEIIKYFTSTWGVTPTSIHDKRVKSTPGYFLSFKTSDTVYLLSRLREVLWEGVEYKFFFKDIKYVEPVSSEISYQSFKVSQCKKCSPINRYDIEVEDNHNYVVNGVVVHNCRALASWDGDRVILMSRGNKEWTVPKHINKALEGILPKDSMFDGELYVHGLQCQKINSLVNKEREDTKTVEYWVYDYPIVEGKEDLPNSERQTGLIRHAQMISKDCPIKFVVTALVLNEDERREQEAKNLEDLFEGSILRNPEGLYKFGYRSINLMKLKEFEDHEFVVLSVGEGKGKMLGHAVFNCKNDINDEEFEVTPALPMEEKKKMFDNPQDYIGKLLTVKHFGRTGAPELKPRFPVGKMFRDEKDLG